MLDEDSGLGEAKTPAGGLFVLPELLPAANDKEMSKAI